MEENKKILMIIGMEKQLEQTICRAANIQPEDALVLKSVFPDISQPYGDFMRDIITLVHRNKAEQRPLLLRRKDGQNPAVFL